MNIPELPVQTHPFVWGMAAGAVARSASSACNRSCK
jgi:hypothetical protein